VNVIAVFSFAWRWLCGGSGVAGPPLGACGGGMSDRHDQSPRDGRREELELSPANGLTATLWCLAVLLAVILGAYWLAAAIYS
jgi:hypothetical protein